MLYNCTYMATMGVKGINAMSMIWLKAVNMHKICTRVCGNFIKTTDTAQQIKRV